ncbi:hypothetical protein FRX31_008945 [Thalictrum thalictroides]|uniref:Uncharacterized protein n=1 Tax=Thalictrum thalictroides TaxID=46969 RepID=A0A7J6WX53_THATH|nr:hypothetical protein FRX31_008945 [Thalictrum thalictroides]
MDQGLKILEKVKLAFDIPIVTDVHKSNQTRFYNQGLSNGSFMAQPKCGYSTQMFRNTQGNMGQPFFSSAPNYLNQQNVGSKQTFGMGTSFDVDNFSYKEGDPVMHHQNFPVAPVEQQKFSNADFQGQSNL